MPGGGARAVIPLLRRPLASAAGNPVEFRNPPPLALYVHVPWCVQKCPYCDFNSHALPAGSSIGQRQTAIPESDYLAACGGRAVPSSCEERYRTTQASLDGRAGATIHFRSRGRLPGA